MGDERRDVRLGGEGVSERIDMPTNEITEECDADYFHIAHTRWQQRATALLKLKGFEI
jgi:hypothetical protein